MSGAQLVVAALEAAHDRSRFACGTPALDRYLREVVTQDVRRRVAACFVMLDGNVVAGYYTLSAASVALTDLPHAIARKLPRYPAIPRSRRSRWCAWGAWPSIRHIAAGDSAQRCWSTRCNVPQSPKSLRWL